MVQAGYHVYVLILFDKIKLQELYFGNLIDINIVGTELQLKVESSPEGVPLGKVLQAPGVILILQMREKDPADIQLDELCCLKSEA